MKNQEELIVGLDIGTTKMCAVVAELSDNNVNIIGIGTHPSVGLRKGVVVNIETTVESINKAVREAEMMAGCEISSVYAGIAGFFIVEDPAEQSLNLPAGEHDLPLVIADRRSNPQRQFTYAPSMMDIMAGYLGEGILVNGTPDAWHSVDQGLHRFRLLNGSNARIFKIAFSDGSPFHVIGTDGGLLAAPVQATSAMLAPGERLEILADFSGYATGTSIATLANGESAVLTWHRYRLSCVTSFVSRRALSTDFTLNRLLWPRSER